VLLGFIKIFQVVFWHVLNALPTALPVVPLLNVLPAKTDFMVKPVLLHASVVVKAVFQETFVLHADMDTLEPSVKSAMLATDKQAPIQ